jgi:hypothetical protein
MTVSYPKVNFLDNLIPLRGGLDGPQLAGWTPGPPAKSNIGCVLYAAQMIPVPPYFARNTLHYGAESYVELRRLPAQAE